MSIVVRFAPASLTIEQYEAVRRAEEDGGLQSPDGRDYHVCFGTDGELKVSEIWDSPEQFEAFVERLMPILADVGIDPGEPQVMEVHNITKR